MPDNDSTIRVRVVVDASQAQAGMESAASAVRAGSAEMAAANKAVASSTAGLAEAQALLTAEIKAQQQVMREYPGMAELVAEANDRVAAAQARVAELQQAAAATAGELAASDASLAGAEEVAAAATETHARALGALRPRLTATTSGIRAYISGVNSIGVIAAVAGAALTIHLADSAAKSTVALDDLAQATGTTVAQLAAMQAAFGENGVAGKDFQVALEHLLEQEQQLGNGSKESAAAFLQLGIPLAEVQDGSMSLIQVLDAVSAKLHSTGSSAADLEAAEYLLGSRQLDLIGVLRQGPEALEALAGKYGSLGDATEQSVGDARALTAAEGELKAAFDGLALKTIPAVTGAVDVLSHPLVAVESALRDGSSFAAEFAAELGTLQAQAQDWTGGASIFGGPAGAHQQQVKSEMDLVAAIETADAVGKNHLATLEANRDAIGRLAGELGSEAVPALQRYANELQKAADAADAKATAALTRAAKQNAEAEKRLLAAAQAQHTEAEHAALADAEAGADRAARVIAEKLRQTAADAKAAANEAFAQQQRNIEAAAQLEIGSIQMRARAKQIGAGEELKEMEAAYQREYEQQVAALNAQLAALKSSDKDYFTEKQRLFDAIQEAHNRLQQNLQRAQAQAMSTDSKSGVVGLGDALGKSFAGLGGGFETMMRGVLEGTQRMSVAWRRMGADMVASFAGTMIKIEMKNLEMEIAMRLHHAQTAAANSAVDSVASANEVGKSAAASLKEISHSAAVAGAKAWSAVVGIPIIGPILAPAAAAASHAGVMAFGALTAAEGGQWQVPVAEQLTMLHRNEMVLPAVHADALRQTVAGGGSGTVNHFHFAPTVHAVDSDGVETMLRNHAPKFAGAVSRHLRTRNVG